MWKRSWCSLEAELVLLDEDNNEISQALLTLSVQKLKVTVNVMPEKKVSVVPDFINKPEGLTCQHAQQH